ncbi:uncharacterized protein ASPGLDRAFT_1387928 [Aspergillus glaucus CBS 516.65]|uniref:Uncharacterized protein n=1 Tax=Aspergillus glaucus CBS 516.65 TaxID=1160497 RepID=A0A1L9VPC1_ASPGL|nr:hypothetical protein ASPGLDRAFT_1387928 [Aspergillus glaucus CBS 516.65]OJJ85756.1 hypothetical protein ASPGLDRAFT_1387928 [Aspergillus glaucus CBS 516.65]
MVFPSPTAAQCVSLLSSHDHRPSIGSQLCGWLYYLLFLLFFFLYSSLFFISPLLPPPFYSFVSHLSILRDALLYLVSLLSFCSSLPSYSFPVGPCIVGLSVKSRHRHQPHRLLSSTDLTKNSTFLRLCKAFFSLPSSPPPLSGRIRYN